jgi:predicted membrane protein
MFTVLGLLVVNALLFSLNFKVSLISVPLVLAAGSSLAAGYKAGAILSTGFGAAVGLIEGFRATVLLWATCFVFVKSQGYSITLLWKVFFWPIAFVDP